MKQPPEDFLVGIVDNEPLIGIGAKLIIMGLVVAAAIAIIWWIRK